MKNKIVKKVELNGKVVYDQQWEVMMNDINKGIQFQAAIYELDRQKKLAKK